MNDPAPINVPGAPGLAVVVVVAVVELGVGTGAFNGVLRRLVMVVVELVGAALVVVLVGAAMVVADVGTGSSTPSTTGSGA